MLSDQDKRDMLADAADRSRRESFRKIKLIQESRAVSFEEYCRFCDELLSARRGVAQKSTAGNFLL
jgi:hypothetical protein